MIPSYLKRISTSFFSLVTVFILTFFILELTPGNRQEFESVKHFETPFAQKPTLKSRTLGETFKHFVASVPVFFSSHREESLTYKQDVLHVFLEAFQCSLFYWIPALLLTLLFGTFFGGAIAVTENEFLRRNLKAVFLFLFNIPTFVLALVLLFLSSILFPFQGNSVERFGPTHFQSVTQFLLPIFTYLLFSVSSLALQVEAWMTEEAQREYSMGLRAKGFSKPYIYARHLFPNLFQLYLFSMPNIFRNFRILSVAIEVTFRITGFGYLSYLSFMNRDTPLLFFMVIAISAMDLILHLFFEGLTLILLNRKRPYQYA